MLPDIQAALAFLTAVRPSGFWVLVSIQPDGEAGEIETRSFAAGELEAAGQWIQRWNQAGRNIYWTVNPTGRPLAKKPSREEIVAMEYLHVDVDPDKRLPLAEERARIERLFTDAGLPKGVPPPTILIDSGGGLQGFWRLEEPVRIDGEPELYEDAKRYNQQLEILFGGDHCHNVDRIMRLPGSVNWPDEKKRATGREPRRATVLRLTEARVSLSGFTPAPRLQTTDTGFVSPAQDIDTGNVRRLRSLDELPPNVNHRLRVVIALGHDPDAPDAWGSRSEPLFWVCCELLRCHIDEETVYSIITDPQFGISESVLDKGSRSEKYALQQIEHARKVAINPLLAEMNFRHAVIGDIGGKCRVLSEAFDDALQRPVVSYQTFEDVRNRWLHRKVADEIVREDFKQRQQGGVDKETKLTPEQEAIKAEKANALEVAGPENDEIEEALAEEGEAKSKKPKKKGKSLTLGEWWLGHSERRYFDRVVFAPGQEPRNCYNLWRGFACEAKPGDCSLYLKHVLDNICKGDEAIYRYVICWMARAVQFPGEAGHVAIVMRGLRGVGKGEFVKHFGALFGRHFLPCTNPIHLVGQFNLHLKDTVVLFADEAFYAGDKRHEAVLKGLITEEFLTLEGKFLGTEAGRNCLHLLMATNNEWVVPAGAHERRFLVLDVLGAQMQNTAYFGPLIEQMQNGGREALLHHLLSMDLSAFEPRNVPKTTALQEQKEHSLSPEEEWWHGKLQTGEIQPGRGWPSWVPCEQLADDFAQHLQGWAKGQRSSRIRLTKLLQRTGCTLGQLGRAVNVEGSDGSVHLVDRPRVYRIPALDVARARWDELFGGAFDWGRPLELVEDVRAEDHF